jgi:hypothetical protein
MKATEHINDKTGGPIYSFRSSSISPVHPPLEGDTLVDFYLFQGTRRPLTTR